MNFHLPHIFRPAARHMRLLPVVAAAAIVAVFASRCGSSPIDASEETRILSLPPQQAVAASDSLDLSEPRNAAIAAFNSGRLYYHEGNHRRAAASLKKGESLVDSNENTPLNFGIARYLFLVNYYYGDLPTAKRYSGKARRIAFALGDSVKIYSAIAYQSAALLEEGARRAAIDTIMAVLRFAPALSVEQRAKMYNNIGFTFQDSDRNVSRMYYEKAIACHPIKAAMANLATSLALEGRLREADSLWDIASATTSDPLRMHILTDIYNTRCQIGDYRGACRMADSLISLNESMERNRMEQDVRGEQMRFEHARMQEKDRQRIRTLVFGIVIVLLLCVITWLVYFYRRSKMKEALANGQLLAQALEQRIATLQMEMEAGLESQNAGEQRIREQQEEIRRLNDRLEKVKGTQVKAYANGHRRFEEIMACNTIVNWHKRDIDDCVEYYRLVDPAYMASLDTLYTGLTAKNRLFMILRHEGKSDADIQQIFGVSPNAIRTMRSRIRAREERE